MEVWRCYILQLGGKSISGRNKNSKVCKTRELQSLLKKIGCIKLRDYGNITVDDLDKYIRS